MKILFVVSNANCHGGTEILTLNLMSALQERGYECTLFSRFYYTGCDPRIFSLSIEKYHIYEKILNSPINKIKGGIESDRYIHDYIEQYAQDNNIDWIINQTYDLIGIISKFKNVKTAQVFNWSIDGFENSLLKYINKKSFVAKWFSMLVFVFTKKRWHSFFSKIDKLIVLTDKGKSELLKYGKEIGINQFVTIPDPLMHSDDSLCLSSLNNKQVVYAGRLSEEKGVMRLLRIWEHVEKMLPDYTLNIYGDGYMKGEMESYVQQHRLSRVVFKGFSKDLEEIYCNADLCLMTSDTEGFGMVLIEAMYYGAPCISFDCPISPKEIIADAGATIPCFDEDKYANEVVALLRDKEKLHNLQLRAIKRARDFYIDKVINLWIDMLNTKD